MKVIFSDIDSAKFLAGNGNSALTAVTAKAAFYS
jgi:hypothetical protein